MEPRNREYVLALDFGTQSVRAIIFDNHGQIVAKEKIEYEPYFSVRPGFAEQDPEVYWNNMCTAIKRVKAQQEELWPRLKGLAVTALRDTPVCLDRDNNVIRPAIVWLDQRMADGYPPLNAVEEALVRAIGMKDTMTILYRRAKSNWLRQHEPENWRKTAKYIQISTYINFRLTGNMKDSCASQIGYIPFDYKNKVWYPENNLKAKLYNVDPSQLPEIVEPGTLLGHISAAVAEETGLPEGLPVFAGGSDKGCETLGVGCVDESTASISLGTTATLQTTSRRYYEAIRFLPPYPAVIPGCYNPEIMTFRGYWMISWFKNEFSKKEVEEAKKLNISPEELLNSRLEEVPPGCRGLILQPLWTPGVLQPKAKGAIIGFGDVHNRAYLYRAIIEGIAFNLYSGVPLIEKKSGRRIESVSVSGGGSQSDTICQITADIFNRPVRRIHTHEASGLGAAIIAFIGAGVFPNYSAAIKQMVHYKDTFEPRPQNARLYHELFSRVYTKIYPRLKDLYDEIQKITRYPDI